MLIEKWNKWIRYPIYIIIGCISGIVSSYGAELYNLALIVQPPLVFFAANLLIFYPIFEKDVKKAILLLVLFYVIYLPILFPVGCLLPLSMPIGGALTFWSYRILRVKIKDNVGLTSSFILFILGILVLIELGHFHQGLNYYPSFFYMVIGSWQTVVFTTIAIFGQQVERQELDQEEMDNPEHYDHE